METPVHVPDDVLETQLHFVEVRAFSPQWVVSYEREGSRVEVARVTQRIIASPPYVLTRIKEGADTEETLHDDRDGVMAALLLHVRSLFPV